jgi:putative flippase GtrA
VHIQIKRFILVGLINTLFGYSIYALMIYIGLSYDVALIISTVCGIIFNFHSIGKLVFNNFKYTLLFKFVLVYVLVYFINLLLIKLFIWLGANAYLGGGLAIIPSAAASFLLNKYLVFNR